MVVPDEAMPNPSAKDIRGPLQREPSAFIRIWQTGRPTPQQRAIDSQALRVRHFGIQLLQADSIHTNPCLLPNNPQKNL
jgi:hypothetical protein